MIVVYGSGAVGRRLVPQLSQAVADDAVLELDPRRRTDVPSAASVAVIASGGPHAPLAATLLARGVAVVSVADDLGDVRELLDLDDRARGVGVPLVVGGGMTPGLTGLLARLVASRLACVDEIHVATHGTAGPACARVHHRALSGRAVGYQDGTWIQRPAGSGRELCWFPEPVGAYDCYRAAAPGPLVLLRSFPEVSRISERVSANRRDRMTAWLPMLAPPHREGGISAVRVEVRGADSTGARQTTVVGIAELAGTAAAATAGAFATAALAGTLPVGVVCGGDPGLDTTGLLRTIGDFGVRLQEFTGVASASRIRATPSPAATGPWPRSGQPDAPRRG